MNNKNESELQNKLNSLCYEIVEKAPIGVFVVDNEGKIEMQNLTLNDFFDSEAERSNPGLSIYNHIKSDQQLKKYLDEAVQNKISVKMDSIKYTSYSDTKEKIFNIWITPILDRQKQIEHLLFSVQDKTLNVMLENKIQRTEKLSAMGVIASGIAGEIKWPISHIMINLDFVERNTPEDSPMRSYLQAIKDDLSRIKFVSKQIVSLTQPGLDTSGKGDIYVVNALFSSNPLKIKLNVIKERGIVIRTQITDMPLRIKADETQLIQAMSHIIQNALEAMPEVGTLTLSIQPIKENGFNLAEITITDTGIGISSENMPNIFKPFFSTKGKKATGLGLMVSYSIIDSLGGAIGIKSTPGEGTSVRIILPTIDED